MFNIDVIQEGKNMLMRNNSIILPVSYCLGIPYAENLAPNLKEVLIRLNDDTEASTLRCLCQMRSLIYRNWDEVSKTMTNSINDLQNIKFFKNVCKDFDRLDIHLTIDDDSNCSFMLKVLDSLCILIKEKVKVLENYLPYWVDISLVNNLFDSPHNGSNYLHSATSIKFRKNIKIYPYQCFINIDNLIDNTFIFNSDKTFINNLYLTANKKVPDNIQFINDIECNTNYLNYTLTHWKDITILVDCENFDVHKFITFVNKLPDTHNINRIVLFDDENTNPVWKSFSKYTHINVEYIKVDRVQHNKSSVDMAIAAYTTKYYYLYNKRYFILASSDSDYCELIKSLNGAEFLVLYENIKFSERTGIRLDKIQTRYLSIDDFHLDVTSTNITILKDVLNTFCDQFVIIDVNELANNLCNKYHMPSDITRSEFVEQYVSNLSIEVKNNKIKFKMP